MMILHFTTTTFQVDESHGFINLSESNSSAISNLPFSRATSRGNKPDLLQVDKACLAPGRLRSTLINSFNPW